MDGVCTFASLGNLLHGEYNLRCPEVGVWENPIKHFVPNIQSRLSLYVILTP